jgi:hypothetical protein
MTALQSPGYRLDLYNQLTAQGMSIQYQGSYDPTDVTSGGQPSLGYSPTLSALGENDINAVGGYPSGAILANLAGSDDYFPNAESMGYPFIHNQGGYWVTGGNGDRTCGRISGRRFADGGHQ